MIDLAQLTTSGASNPFSPSAYQQRIFTELRNGKGNCIIEAVAGSGKTTTLQEAFRFLPGDAEPLFLAFNKSISEELRNRGLPSSTFHSLCLGQLHKAPALSKAKVESGKVRKHFQALVAESLHDDYDELPRLVSLAKNTGIGLDAPPEPSDFLPLIEAYEHDFPDAFKAAHFAVRILNASNENQAMIDFDDMLYFPLLLNIPMPQYSHLFIDEAQDLNEVQLRLLERMGRVGSRYFFVGDRHQAIYGFRGAGIDSMDTIALRFATTQLPLSISYRCPSAVVAICRPIVPQIEASPTAPPGSVRELPDFSITTLAQKPCIILCRNKRPLFALAHKCIKQRLPVRLLTKELLHTFRAIIRRAKPKKFDFLKPADWQQLRKAITGERDAHMQEALAKNRLSAAEVVADRYDALLEILTSPSKEPEALVAEYFSNERAPILFSTIHKAKGLEFSRVFILDRHLIPSKFATTEWQLAQEQNLLYVAQTRTKSELFFITTQEQ